MGERSIESMNHPSHDWGEMADNPFMTVGRKDAAMRSMLCRVWSRSGGDAAMFDQLIPGTESDQLELPSRYRSYDTASDSKLERIGQRRRRSGRGVQSRAALQRSTIKHMEEGVKGFTVRAAATNIEGWEATLEKSEDPGVKTLVKDLEHLKKLIQDEKPKGDQIMRLLAKFGQETATFAGKSEGRNTEMAKALGEALAHMVDNSKPIDKHLEE